MFNLRRFIDKLWFYVQNMILPRQKNPTQNINMIELEYCPVPQQKFVDENFK
jgi:hypothetical protein